MRTPPPARCTPNNPVSPLPSKVWMRLPKCRSKGQAPLPPGPQVSTLAGVQQPAAMPPAMPQQPAAALPPLLRMPAAEPRPAAAAPPPQPGPPAPAPAIAAHAAAGPAAASELSWQLCWTTDAADHSSEAVSAVVRTAHSLHAKQLPAWGLQHVPCLAELHHPSSAYPLTAGLCAPDCGVAGWRWACWLAD